MQRETKVLGWLLTVGVLAVLASFNVGVLAPYSGFAAGLLKAALAVGLFALLDRFVLPFRLADEVRAGNVAYGLVLLALAVLLAATVATAAPVPLIPDQRREKPMKADVGPVPGPLDTAPARVRWLPASQGGGTRPGWVTVARAEVGTVERPPGSNRGARVEAYQASVRIPPGSPWCAGFVRWVLDRGGVDVVDSRGASVRVGVATAWLAGRGRIEARAVERGLTRPPRGSVVVWRNGTSWTGHLGVVDWWDVRCGVTVEGNTSSGSAGSQRDGDGVWVRNRCVSPGAHFRIVGFVPVAS